MSEIDRQIIELFCQLTSEQKQAFIELVKELSLAAQSEKTSL